MSPADDIFSGKNKFDGELCESELEHVVGGFINDMPCFEDNPWNTECPSDGCLTYTCIDANNCGALMDFFACPTKTN